MAEGVHVEDDLPQFMDRGLGTVGLVAGFFGAECCFEVDAASADDGHQQDEGVGCFVADVGDPPPPSPAAPEVVS